MPCQPICCTDGKRTKQFPACNTQGWPINYFRDPCIAEGMRRVQCPVVNNPPGPPSPTGCTYDWMCANEWQNAGPRRPGRVADAYCQSRARPGGCEGNQVVCTVTCTPQNGYTGPVVNYRPPLIGRSLPFPYYTPRTGVAGPTGRTLPQFPQQGSSGRGSY